jgi:hypothetical protein
MLPHALMSVQHGNLLVMITLHCQLWLLPFDLNSLFLEVSSIPVDLRYGRECHLKIMHHEPSQEAHWSCHQDGVLLTWRSSDPDLQPQQVGGALDGHVIVDISAGDPQLTPPFLSLHTVQMLLHTCHAHSVHQPRSGHEPLYTPHDCRWSCPPWSSSTSFAKLCL